MKKILHREDGFILPLVLVVIALLAGGVAYILTQGMTELQANVLNRDYQVCILTGKNGIAIVQAELEEDINYSGTNGKVSDENGGTYQISVFKTSENLRYVEVESAYKSYQKKFAGEIELKSEGAGTLKGSIIKFNWKMLGAV